MDPPWQHAAAPAAASQSSQTAPEGAESLLLKELVQAIEASDQPVTDGIQAIVEKAKKPLEPPPTAKSARQAWDKLEKKRKQLHQAQAARSNLHKNWSAYIDASVQRWKTFVEDFAQKDQALDKKIQEAKEAMQEARDKYDKVKDAIDKQDAVILEEVEEISDAMDEDATDKIPSAEEIQEGLTTMITSLEAIRMRPAEDADTEQASKKAKLGHQLASEPSPAFGAAALKPFPKPDK